MFTEQFTSRDKIRYCYVLFYNDTVLRICGARSKEKFKVPKNHKSYRRVFNISKIRGTLTMEALSFSPALNYLKFFLQFNNAHINQVTCYNFCAQSINQQFFPSDLFAISRQTFQRSVCNFLSKYVLYTFVSGFSQFVWLILIHDATPRKRFFIWLENKICNDVFMEIMRYVTTYSWSEINIRIIKYRVRIE